MPLQTNCDPLQINIFYLYIIPKICNKLWIRSFNVPLWVHLSSPLNPNFQPHFQIEHTNPCNSILGYIVSFYIINLSTLQYQPVHHGFETIGKS